MGGLLRRLFPILLCLLVAVAQTRPPQPDDVLQPRPAQPDDVLQPGPARTRGLGDEDSDEEPDLRDSDQRKAFCARHWSALECWKAATTGRLTQTALVQLSSARDVPLPSGSRTVECVRDTVGAERCKYAALCYDGVYDDEHGNPKKRFYARGGPDVKEEATASGRRIRRDDRFWTYHMDDMPDITDVLLPNDLDIDVHIIPADQWDDLDRRKQLFRYQSIRSLPAAHMAFTTLALGENGGNNLFHVSAAISGVADAQFHNETGWFPPLTTYYVFNAWGEWNDWTGEMVQQLLPDDAKVELINHVDETYCWDGAVLYGERPTNIMSGPADAERFRTRVYSRLGLTPRTTHDEATFPLKVLLFGRGTNNRAVTNPSFSELVEHIRQYPFWWDETVYVDDMFTFTIEEQLDKRSFKEQVQMFSDADIIVGSHGAGATNILFAHEHTPFIELLPYHFTPPCYRNLAGVCGLPYFSLESEPLPKETYRHQFPDDDIKVATAWHGVDEGNEGYFHGEYFKFGRISVDVKAFLSIFKTALDQVPMMGFGVGYGHLSSDPIVPPSLFPLVHAGVMEEREARKVVFPCETASVKVVCDERRGCAWRKTKDPNTQLGLWACEQAVPAAGAGAPEAQQQSAVEQKKVAPAPAREVVAAPAREVAAAPAREVVAAPAREAAPAPARKDTPPAPALQPARNMMTVNGWGRNGAAPNSLWGRASPA